MQYSGQCCANRGTDWNWWSKMQNLETNQHKCVQLILNKGAKVIQCKKTNFKKK